MDIIKKGVDIEKIVKQASKLQLVKIKREEFLEKELKKYCSEETIQKAIETTPRIPISIKIPQTNIKKILAKITLSLVIGICFL